MAPHTHLRRLPAWLAVAVWICGVAAGSPALGQKLGQVRHEIQSPDAKPAPAPSKESSKEKRRREREEKRRRERQNGSYFSQDDDDDDVTLGSMFATAGWQIAGAVTQAVFVGDPNAHGFDINYEIEPAQPAGIPNTPEVPTNTTMYFAHYPYADGFDGYSMQSSYVPARPLTAVSQLQFSFGSDFDGLQWYTGKGLFEWSRSRFGFDAEWTYFTENVAPGQKDEMHLGDVNLLWRRIQSQKWLLRWGLGMVWSHDQVGTDAGLNGTLKVDYFPRRPWVVSGEYDLGKLGDATAQHLQIGVGATWNHLELFSAYDYRRFDNFDIAGPVFGIRFWW